MKLNSNKCMFGVSSRNFLRFMVHNKGIEANPEKIKAILEIRSPAKVKEVQKLTGCVEVLNWFVARAIE